MTKKRTDSAPPTLRLSVGHTDAELAGWMDRQRAWMRALADRVERGEPLAGADAIAAAAALRVFADRIPDRPPRSVGKPPTFDAGEAALEIAHGVATGKWSKTAGIAALAERHDVSVEGMREAIKPHYQTAETLTRK